MPIQIPQVKRFDAVAPESVGRIETQLPDTSRATQQVQQAASGLLNEAQEYQDRVEKQTAEVEANARTNELDRWYKAKMYGTKDQTGLKYRDDNPSPLYDQFDGEFQKEYDR